MSRLYDGIGVSPLRIPYYTDAVGT